jgi:hypothetical protein
VLATNGTFFAKGTPVKEDARATKFAELLADLLWRAKSAGFRERDELAANILSCVEPLALAPAFVESLSTLNSQIRLNRNLSVSISEDEGYARGETEDYDLIISDEGWSVLARAFVPRIRDFLVREDAGMFERGTDSYALFKLWDRYDQGTVKDWIESRIKDDPEFTLRLLRSAKTDISSSSYGAWGYSWVCAVASYPVIREALDKMFGEALSDDNDDRGDVVLARSFLREHQDRLEKKQAEIRQDGSKDVNAESDDGKA